MLTFIRQLECDSFTALFASRTSRGHLNHSQINSIKCIATKKNKSNHRQRLPQRPFAAPTGRTNFPSYGKWKPKRCCQRAIHSSSHHASLIHQLPSIAFHSFNAGHDARTLSTFIQILFWTRIESPSSLLFFERAWHGPLLPSNVWLKNAEDGNVGRSAHISLVKFPSFFKGISSEKLVAFLSFCYRSSAN